ncbi:hypothetical protein BJF79_40290 [Actinomadura sp. CNU-125]|uniref:hypothetical protein n=1 Tax=Actinomadura sp. CNU-125 TaxID=1904961 RepID=UPI000963B06E|nr:hypothetical protein [Actinomadura sp. CNU-125]OLT29830.1 hypothetical protein BJF79_40290 [Actinomadura sp. CNU-125]
MTFVVAATIFTRLPRRPVVSVDGGAAESVRTGHGEAEDAPVTLVAGLRAFAARRWLVALTLSDAAAGRGVHVRARPGAGARDP